MSEKHIFVKNAKENNLKGIDVLIPRDKLVVFTGISGSGKSSLAFDTIFAEGQRRYVESLSAYARQFLGQMDKPDVEYIEGLSPAISIDQKTTSQNPRSTVGTITEIYDYLRLLFARIGTPYCPKCGKEISRQTVDQICDKILAYPQGTRLVVQAPVVRERKGEYSKLFESLKKSGYVRVVVDGSLYTLDDEIKLDKNYRHSISVVIDRIVLKEDSARRISDSVETALRLAEGLVLVSADDKETLFSDKYTCPDCGITIEELEPRMFSFNSPFGACPECTGLGFKLEFDEALIIPDPSRPLDQDAVRVLGFSLDAGSWASTFFASLAAHYGFSTKTPFRDLPKKFQDLVLYGSNGESFPLKRDGYTGRSMTWEGIIPMMTRRYRETSSDYARLEYERFMRQRPCPVCGGKRLKTEVLSVKIAGMNIHDVCCMSIDKTLEFFEALELDETKAKIAYMVLKEIKARLRFLLDVGLNYLTLWRNSASLSGGEAQRIRLATQIGSGLVGVLYILDEPSIGLHQRDNRRLIGTLTKLRDLGNTLIVVEHDEETILAADHIIDIGPGAGIAGGYLVAEGTPRDIMACERSITGQYLSGKRSVPIPRTRRTGNGSRLIVRGAAMNNLKNITVSIPTGCFVAVTGVSGSGKSSLVTDTIMPFLAHKINGTRKAPGIDAEIENWHLFDKAIEIDQSAIGRTPRSNPATYTGLFGIVRELYAQTPDAKERGYGPGRFSFNVKGGRCENCSGDGIIRIEMNFLPDVYVPCSVCKSKRYNRETLEVKYKGKSIADVLDMTVGEALEFFQNISKIKNRLQTLSDVGLSYIKLGQSATTLSGGEAQRVKLATELARRATGKTIYILDEPTTGLSAADVDKLIAILQRLVESGNTVITIEHNLDIIKVADYVVDLGPEGGDKGGEIIVCGTPEEVAKCEKSYTGQYLAKILNLDK